MRKLIIKAFIFALPIIAFFAYGVWGALILPVDFYTFRSWEAVSVYEKNPILSGPFYPNMYLKKSEFGDLSGLTKYPVPKDVEWFTDKYGFRKQNSNTKKIDIVVVGDSAIAGSSLTQNDMFSEVLEKRRGVGVYPYAPSNFLNFTNDSRFKKNPPKVLIVESVEKIVLNLPEVPPADVMKPKPDYAKEFFQKLGLSKTFITNMAVSFDRLKKQTFVNYLYARLWELPRHLTEPAFRNQRGVTGMGNFTTFGRGIRSEMVFYTEPEAYFTDWKESDIRRVVFTLRQYQDKLKETNTKLIFMPIPNKENIYWRQVNGGKPQTNLKRLIDVASRTGIPTIDLYTVYNDLYNKNPDKLLYNTDDTHWNPYGVQAAVGEAVKKLNEIGY